MPRLSEIADADTLDNLYADKTIIYVEGESDEAVLTDMMGPNVRDRLEFKVPKVEGSGYAVVTTRVSEERSRNKKIWGLLDGEASVPVGALKHLVETDAELFKLPEAEHDGLIFLGEAELENVMLRHGDTPAFLAEHVPLAAVGKASPDEFTERLASLGRRFYILASLKFAAIELHGEGVKCGEVDSIAGWFQDDKHGIMAILSALKQKMKDKNGNWDPFLQRVVAIQAQARATFSQKGLDTPARDGEIYKLAAGKELLKRVISVYKGTTGWEGLLAARVARSPYADRFRAALLGATNN